MITGFNKQTHELTDYEVAEILPVVLIGLKTRIGKKSCITNKEMVHALKSKGWKTTTPRMRKVIHHIRVEGLIENLLASSRGYWVSNDKDEVAKYIKGLGERERSINEVRQALEIQFLGL